METRKKGMVLIGTSAVIMLPAAVSAISSYGFVAGSISVVAFLAGTLSLIEGTHNLAHNEPGEIARKIQEFDERKRMVDESPKASEPEGMIGIELVDDKDPDYVTDEELSEETIAEVVEEEKKDEGCSNCEETNPGLPTCQEMEKEKKEQGVEGEVPLGKKEGIKDE